MGMVDIKFLCEYNRQYENRTANQVAPGRNPTRGLDGDDAGF